jgi:hypothetical protein
MNLINHHKLLFWLCSCLGLGLILLFGGRCQSDPRAAFLAELEKLIEQAHQGQHLSLQKKLSDEAKNHVTNYGMTVPQALLTARKLDLEGGIRYRVSELQVFYPRDYAEVEMQRSGPSGDFSNARSFPLPFIYRKGEWLVAGAFRGERELSNPFDF